jgi:hypothetical protein
MKKYAILLQSLDDFVNRLKLILTQTLCKHYANIIIGQQVQKLALIAVVSINIT